MKRKKSSENEKIRVCIFMNTFHVGANILMNKIIRDQNIEIVGIFWKSIWATSKNHRQHSLWVGGVKWLRRGGYWFVFGLVGIVIFHFIPIFIVDVLLLGLIFKGKKYFRSTTRIAQENGIPIFVIQDINEQKTVQKIKSLHPDVILSNSFVQIIGREILDIPTVGVINIHPGILPVYRGLLPHFWAMVHGDTTLGVTLHYVDEGVDTGAVIDQKEFTIEAKESFYKVWKKTAHYNSLVLKKYFEQLRKGKRNWTSSLHNNEHKKTQFFKFPTHEAYRRFIAQGKKMFSLNDFV